MPIFTDTEIVRLFGFEDGENERPDRLKEYFFRNRAYENLVGGLPIRILVGHKGVGKSALLKIAYLEDKDRHELAIWLQPDVLKDVAESSDRSFVQLVNDWKAALTHKIFAHIAALVAANVSSVKAGIQGSIESLVRGLTNVFKAEKTLIYDEISREAVSNFLNTKRIVVYLDDLDRGWEANRQDIVRISALLNAIRDLCGSSQNLSFRLGLRSDVYFLVRTSDESTDKIESNVIWLTWSNHEILAMMAKRVETYFGRVADEQLLLGLKQRDLAQKFNPIMVPIFHGVGKWEKVPTHRALLSLTRRRPRDFVKLLSSAARVAYKNSHKIIQSGDIAAIFEAYSSERLQDIINEFRSELPLVKPLVYGMRPTRKEKTTLESYMFTNDQLVTKLKNLMQQNSFSFVNGHVVTAHSLAEFLYKIDLITARKEEGGIIVRRYFDESRHLQNQFVDFGFKWEVHPAYRWALQPGEPDAIFKDVDLIADND
ncbi:MAG TPA: hypothetical protein VHC40_01325 [Rhizomicrobium sp.]|nr:hypothetical protein [Rhizomicrobium sp.]